MRFAYITNDLANNTNYKSVYNAWNNDDFDIVVADDEVWWLERDNWLNKRTRQIIHREMKRLYPKLIHISEV